MRKGSARVSECEAPDLVGLRRHHPHILADLAGDMLEHVEAGGLDAVVIGDQDAHQVLRASMHGQAAHIGLQHVGDADGAVRLLIILQDGDQRAADGDARAVQRMDEAGVLGALRAVARIHAAGLEVAAHRAGGNLAIGPLPRQPDLDVVGLLRGEAHVAGGEHDDAVGNSRVASAPPRRRLSCAHARAADCSGVVMETSSTLENWCWRIMPRVSLPAAPASARKQGVQAVYAQRQLGLVDDLLADEIGQRHLGGGNEPDDRTAPLLNLLCLHHVCLQRRAVPKLIISKLRQLRGAEHGVVTHEQRRIDFGVAVLARMQIEHELGERPFEPRQRPLQHDEAAA